MRGKMQDPPAPKPDVISASLPGSLLGHPVSAWWKISLGNVKSVLAESQNKWERTSGWLCCQWEEICALDAATLNQVIKCQKEICNVLVCSRFQWRLRLGGGLGFFFLLSNQQSSLSKFPQILRLMDCLWWKLAQLNPCVGYYLKKLWLSAFCVF